MAKDRIRKEATKGNDVGNILFNVWNVFTEQPDTRSWQSLPAEIKSSTFVASSGQYTLEAGVKTYDFDIREGQTTVVWISRQGNNATMWHKQLGRL